MLFYLFPASTKIVGLLTSSSNSSLKNFFVCPDQLKVPQNLDYRLTFTAGKAPNVVQNCGAPCYKLFFGSEDILKIRKILGLTSVATCLICLFALATYLVSCTARFNVQIINWSWTKRGGFSSYNRSKMKRIYIPWNYNFWILLETVFISD